MTLKEERISNLRDGIGDVSPKYRVHMCGKHFVMALV